MRTLLSLALCCLCLSLVASADTVNFQLNGTFTDSSTVSGTLAIDRTAGTVLSAILSYKSNTFSTILAQGPFDCCADPSSNPVLYRLWVGSSNSTFPALRFGISGTAAVDSLIGYTGGALCAYNAQCGPDSDGNTWVSSYRDPSGNPVALQSGSLAPVPEPSSLIMLGSGLAGLVSVTRRKRN